MKTNNITWRIIVVSITVAACTTALAGSQHFHEKGKLPSKFTIEKQQQLRKTLPFADKKDFEEQKKGFIAAPDYKQIMAEKGHVAWDMGKYEFLLEDGKDYDSIHPSLQRQATLNMNYGLYEVIPAGSCSIR
jgi:alkyl sulfatase BDS1-like metallo-beta-lactamase superfamily hydrolase